MFARQSFVAQSSGGALDDPAVGTSSARTKKNVAAQNAVIIIGLVLVDLDGRRV